MDLAGRRKRSKEEGGGERRFMDDKLVEEDAEDQRVRWRELIGCSDS